MEGELYQVIADLQGKLHSEHEQNMIMNQKYADLLREYEQLLEKYEALRKEVGRWTLPRPVRKPQGGSRQRTRTHVSSQPTMRTHI